MSSAQVPQKREERKVNPVNGGDGSRGPLIRSGSGKSLRWGYRTGVAGMLGDGAFGTVGWKGDR